MSCDMTDDDQKEYCRHLLDPAPCSKCNGTGKTKTDLGLITLTEERLKEIIKEAFTKGFWCRSAGYRFDIPALPYASRIIEALKKEG